MKAISRRVDGKLRQTVSVRAHELTADEPKDHGGEDAGPSPQELLAASLASCTAITIEMYAKRKGWPIEGLEVDCDYTPAERGCATNFKLVMKMPAHLSEEHVDKLRVIAAKCPVHRTLEGEVLFDERVEIA